MTEIEHLNKWLIDQGGTALTGQPVYRLIWSDKALENRFGTFNDFTEGGLFIRQVTETRLVQKYNYIHERWILEMWAPGDLTAHKETPDAMNGDYIPVYVFEGKNRKYLAPTRKVLRFILGFMRGSIPQDEEIPQELLDDKEIENQVDSMMDHPDFKTSGPTRNSIAYTKGLRDVAE